MISPKFELVENGAELAPNVPLDLSQAHLMLGIDAGSTTVKLSVIDEDGTLVYANYERHHTDVRATALLVCQSSEAHWRDTHVRRNHRFRRNALGAMA